jgi:exonuclease III
MIVLSWNCRGLGNPRTVRSLYRLVKEKKPTLVFLMETKVSRRKVSFLPSKLGLENMFVVDCRGKSGGLILLWKSMALVEIQNFNNNHINAVIKNSLDRVPWKLTGFYGHPEVSMRRHSWALLRHLATINPTPWLCLGDFNEIVSLGEKSRSTARPRSQWYPSKML